MCRDCSPIDIGNIGRPTPPPTDVGGGRVVMIGQTRGRRRGKWHAWPEEVYEPPAPDAPTATAAVLAAAAALAPAPDDTDGLPPEVERAAIAAGRADRRARSALVNGGPPRDALDDGR